MTLTYLRYEEIADEMIIEASDDEISGISLRSQSKRYEIGHLNSPASVINHNGNYRYHKYLVNEVYIAAA